MLCFGQEDAEITVVDLSDTRPGPTAEILAPGPVLSGKAHSRSAMDPDGSEMSRMGCCSF